MKADKTPTEAELVVLGMLAEHPQYGYDLNKLIEQRGVRNWTSIGFSSTYYLLNKLEQKGYAQSPVSDDQRRLYSITAQGRSICLQSTRHLLGTRASPRTPFLVGIANSHMLAQPEANELLGGRRNQLVDQLGVLKHLRETQQPLPAHAERLFRYSIAMIEAEIAWLDNEMKEGMNEITR